MLQHQLWIKICCFLHHPISSSSSSSRMNVLSFADITRKSDILVVIVITNQLWKEEYLQYTENSGTLYKVYSLNIRFRADWQTTLIGNVTNKWWPSDNNLDIDTFHLNICCYCHCVKLKLVANQNNAITSNMMAWLTQWFPYQM